MTKTIYYAILKAGSKKRNEDKEMAENRLTAEQIQQLVDVIAKCSQIASWTLTEIPWVTAAKREQLKIVSAA